MPAGPNATLAKPAIRGTGSPDVGEAWKPWLGKHGNWGEAGDYVRKRVA